MNATTSRLLAVGLLVAVVGVVLGGVLNVYRSYSAGQAAIEEKVDRVQRFERLAAQLPGLERQLAQLGRSDDRRRLMIDAESDVLAAATLQQRMKAIVGRFGGSLTSTRVLDSETRQGFTRIGLDVRLAVGMKGLRGVLYELESGLPLLVVEDLVVVSRRRGSRRRARQGNASLDVRFRLVGFMAAERAVRES